MEADWEIEIGGDAPVIDAAWSGFVDLRAEPDRIFEIVEATQLPALGQALLQLNASKSPVWTAKCDVWQPEEFDPDEMDADPAETRHALACYIDLLSRGDRPWNMLEFATQSAVAWTAKLCVLPLKNCRADLVIRRAFFTPECEGLGITAYLTACGADHESAQRALGATLAAFVDSIAPVSPTSEHASRYNGSEAGE